MGAHFSKKRIMGFVIPFSKGLDKVGNSRKYGMFFVHVRMIYYF